MASNQVKQKGRMPQKDYQKIQANFSYLVDHIKEPVKLGNKLFEKNVFDADETDEIQKIYMTAEKGRSTATHKLLMYLLNCGDAYERFTRCLRELGYKEILDILENTTNGKNKTNLMTEQDKSRHQLEDLHKDHDLTKQDLENLKKEMETLKTRHDADSKQMLKDKKRIDELETRIKTLTLDEDDTIQPQLAHGSLSGNTSDTLADTSSGNTSGTSADTLSGNTSDTSDKKDTRQQQQQQLFDACLHGTLDDIKNMVNIDVNVGDSDDQTPLFNCCTSSVSPVDKIKYLVSHQADINARDSDNNTILHWACWFGTLSTVKYLVDDLHMDVNTTGRYNCTPLFYCCSSSVNTVAKIKYLVSHQADINARASDNTTILHWACYSGTLSTVKYLVDDLHMDVNTTGWSNQTPLFYCCSSSVSPVDKMKYLVSHQADINARDSNNNNTILHQACLAGTLSTVKYLVDDLHIDVNTTGSRNRTPLFYCCISSVSPVDKIQYLVSHQADINARDSYNHTILHAACESGTLSTVQYLVDCLHLDVHVKDKDGNTPLDYCRRSPTESTEKIKYITDQIRTKPKPIEAKSKPSLFKSLFRR